jgi:hypothetical protein
VAEVVGDADAEQEKIVASEAKARTRVMENLGLVFSSSPKL